LATWVSLQAELFADDNPTNPKYKKNGAGEGTRTHDLRFTKPLLYQLSYSSPFFPFRKKGKLAHLA
jgi:hypothetical protein